MEFAPQAEVQQSLAEPVDMIGDHKEVDELLPFELAMEAADD